MRGLIRPRLFRERSAIQTLPAPYAMPNGRDANGIFLTTAFVPGLIRTTRARTRSDVQTEPAAEMTMPDCGPTETFATVVSGGGAADCATAATPATANATVQ